VWTPTVTATAKEVDQALPRACQQISYAIDYYQHGHVDPFVHTQSLASGLAELLIIDEADRLKTTGLEQVRDYYDRHSMGVILIGMPGIERRLARYPQLYSRIGFAHEYRPLNPDELTAVLTRRWHADGLAPGSGIDDDDDDDGAAHPHSRDRHHRPDHRRQLPPRRPPAHPDPTHPADQQPPHHQPRGRRSRPRSPPHRQLIPTDGHLPLRRPGPSSANGPGPASPHRGPVPERP